jgi:hypothetical protein
VLLCPQVAVQMREDAMEFDRSELVDYNEHICYEVSLFHSLFLPARRIYFQELCVSVCLCL